MPVFGGSLVQLQVGRKWSRTPLMELALLEVARWAADVEVTRLLPGSQLHGIGWSANLGPLQLSEMVPPSGSCPNRLGSSLRQWARFGCLPGGLSACRSRLLKELVVRAYDWTAELHVACWPPVLQCLEGWQAGCPIANLCAVVWTGSAPMHLVASPFASTLCTRCGTVTMTSVLWCTYQNGIRLRGGGHIGSRSTMGNRLRRLGEGGGIDCRTSSCILVLATNARRR